MAATAIESLVTLFASSTALNMAYVALPDYRYRNNITEYLEHLVDLKYQSDEPTSGKQKVSSLLDDARRRHSRKTNGEEYWLQFLTAVHTFPRGHSPNEIIDYPLEGKKEPHWLQKPLGKVFRNLYMRHFDNVICITLAIAGLVFTVAVQWMSIFQNGSIAQWFEPIAKSNLVVFFIAGVLGILAPSSFAFLGRVCVCHTARASIDRAVESLLGDATDTNLEQMESRLP